MLKRRLNLKVSSDVAELTKINQSQPYAAYILRVWPVNGSMYILHAVSDINYQAATAA